MGDPPGCRRRRRADECSRAAARTPGAVERLGVVVTVVAGTACGGDAPRAEPPAAVVRAAPVPAPRRPPTYASPEFGFRVTLPERWRGRYETSGINGALAAREFPRAEQLTAFLYVPADTRYQPAPLLSLVVYRRSAWPAARRRQDGAADTLAGLGEYVVVAVPAARPAFRAGSPDAAAFDSLQTTVEELRAGFQPPR